MKTLLALFLLVTVAAAAGEERPATYLEKGKFCKAIAAYFKEQSEGEDVRLSLSMTSCRAAAVRVSPNSDTSLDLEARVIVWFGLIPMPVTCFADMESGEIVPGSQDCTY